MASGNLDALSAIATVLDPNIDEQFPNSTLISIAETNLLPAPTDPQLMEEVEFEAVDGNSSLGVTKDMDGESEGTYCDLDVSTQQSRQQLQPRFVKSGMKETWQKELDDSQYIACSVPGCEMRYSTLFSFERHYKWCTGDKGQGVEKCPYCDCQYLATVEGIEDHVAKDHPSYIPDYHARRVAKKILAEGRELERKTQLEREAKALELSRSKESGSGHKRQTCYSRKAGSLNELDDTGRKKGVRFKKNSMGDGSGEEIARGRGRGRAKKIPIVRKSKPIGEGGKDEEGENVDDPSNTAASSPSNRGRRTEPIIKVTRNWKVQRRTYSRGSAQIENKGTTSQSEDDESQQPTTSLVQFDSQDLVEGEIHVEETGEVIQYVASESLVSGESIPIETEGCITIGTDYQDSDDDNYQLVIVTGTTDAAKAVQVVQEIVNNQPKKLSLVEEIAKEFEDDLDDEKSVPELEANQDVKHLEDSVKSVVITNPPSNALEVVESSTVVKVLDSETVEAISLQEPVITEATAAVVDSESIETPVNDTPQVEIFLQENELLTTEQPAISNQVYQLDDIQEESKNIAVVISQELGDSEEIFHLGSSEFEESPTKSKKRPRVLLPDRESDEDSIDQFQLKVPEGLSTTISDDFLPKNPYLDSTLKGFSLDKEDPASTIANIQETPSTSANVSNGSFSRKSMFRGSISKLFDKVANEKDQEEWRNRRSLEIDSPNRIKTRGQSSNFKDTPSPYIASKKQPKPYVRRKRDNPVHQAIFGEKPVPEKFHMINPSKGAIPANIQSIIAASGGAQQIKLYTSGKDGTLEPLDDLSLLSGSSQIKFMSHNKDGKLIPVEGDPDTLLRTVKRMVNPGVKGADMMDEDGDLEFDDYFEIPKKRGPGRPPKHQASTPALTRLRDGSVYIRKPSFLTDSTSVIPRSPRGRGQMTYSPIAESSEPPKKKRGRPPKYKPPILTRKRTDGEDYDNYSPSSETPPLKRTRLNHSQLDDTEEFLNSTPASAVENSVEGIKDNTDLSEVQDESLDVSEINGRPPKSDEEELEDDASTTSSQRNSRARKRNLKLEDEDFDESSQTGNESSTNVEKAYRRRIQPKETSFKCSACQKEFANRINAKNHIISRHNGLGKVNDDTPLTNREMNSFLRIALKMKKYLICYREGCGRHLRSITGFLCHEKTCGVEIQMVRCEHCGRSIKETTLQTHMNQHKLSEQRRLAVQEAEESADPVKRKPKLTRKAAQMANSRLEQFVRAELGDELEDKPFHEEPVNSKSDDNDYVVEEEEEQKQVEELDSENGSKVSRVKGKSEKWIRAKLKKNFARKYEEPDEARVASSDDMETFKKEFSENSIINCKVENCERQFTNVIGMVNHWQQCGLALNWRCLICNEYSVSSIKKLYLHLLTHDKSSITTNDKPISSTGSKLAICYRDLQIPEMDKHGGLEKMILNPKLVTWTYEYYSRHHSEELYSRFKPFVSDWTLLESLEEYLPTRKESVNFKVRGVEESADGDWIKLKLFEAQDPSIAEQVTMNVGGPVWASAWCPIPMTEGAKAEQYAAISCSINNELQSKLDNIESDKGLLQIWSFGNLSRTTLDTTPKMALAIAHDYGTIWDLKWCPSGCWDDPNQFSENINYLPRLGLLALACGDGNVRILSIPHPTYLPVDETSVEPICFYSVTPVCVLPPPEPGLIVNSFKTACTCVAFEKTDGHGKVATGYGNGLICLWDLQSDSPLILARRRQIEPEPLPQLLRPFHHFLAHSSGITSLTFSPVPHGRFLNTAGMDKLFKLWDLDDTSIPVDQTKKCLARKLQSSCHYCGVFVAMDQGYNLNGTHSLYKESGYYDYASVGTSYSNSCIWDLSVSEWLNSELSSNAAGGVNLITLPLLTKNLEHFKTFKNFRWPIYSTDIIPLEDSIENVGESSQNSLAISKTSNNDTFAKITNKYGLVFRDAPLSSINQLSSPNIKQLTKPEHMNTCDHGEFPLASVNTVCWNPNLGCHLWFLSAGQSGLARLSCMSALRQPAASRLIAKLQQNNNEKT